MYVSIKAFIDSIKNFTLAIRSRVFHIPFRYTFQLVLQYMKVTRFVGQDFTSVTHMTHTHTCDVTPYSAIFKSMYLSNVKT